MLKSLYISSFVIIDKMRIDFENGMSVLTGETGAGKSIVIDALGQLCGNRASLSLIRKNCSKAIIEGIFDIDMTDELKDIFDDAHIELDDQIVITKEIFDTGKSNVKVNYQNASNNLLKLIMPYVIDIHSQFETQKLFEEKNHICLLDEYANKELNSLQNQYISLFNHYKELKTKLKNAIEEDMSDEQLEFLQSQLDEIEQSTYTDIEIEEFENELKILQNYEKVSQYIKEFDHLMSSSQGSLSLMKEALNNVHSIVDYGEFSSYYENMYNLYYNIIDEHENIMDEYHSFHFDEYRFNELQEILLNVNRLKRKYGFSMDAILEKRDEIINNIEIINNRDEYIMNLEKEISDIENKCLESAREIHNIRVKKAKEFEESIQLEFKDLYLEKAIFKVHFEVVELNKLGIDKVSFMISVNRGQNLSLLNESASGGEISRIMLAIKTIILHYNQIETIIFDEVDTGVSGKVATGIGEKMKSLSKDKQVICITHLPQVAALAHHHYSIEKEMLDIETVTSVHLLDSSNRVNEIAKMLSGEIVTHEAIENAKKLLNV